ncbi:MAG: LPS export ABC transporter periplasmic protein LptC [Gemmatimonadaceae bacterium]
MTGRQMLIVGALCSAVAACTDRTAPVQVAKDALADSADQVLFHIKTVLTDRGLLRAELEADSAFFFDDNTRIELRKVETTFFKSTGERSSVLTSREGTYNTRLQETEARGDVVVVSNEGRRLETSQVKYQQGQNEISSDSAFVLTEKGRRLEGVGFVSDPDMRNVRVKNVTTGGGTFTLPGQ